MVEPNKVRTVNPTNLFKTNNVNSKYKYNETNHH